MKKISSFLLLAFFACSGLMAQRAHVVYAEALGGGLFYSLNYDVRFKPQPGGLGARVGFTGTENILVAPFHFNYISGQKHGIELGIGFTLLLNLDGDATDQSNRELWPNAAVMYRYQGNNGLNLRVGLSPFLPPINNNSYLDGNRLRFAFWPAASVGYRF